MFLTIIDLLSIIETQYVRRRKCACFFVFCSRANGFSSFTPENYPDRLHAWPEIKALFSFVFCRRFCCRCLANSGTVFMVLSLESFVFLFQCLGCIKTEEITSDTVKTNQKMVSKSIFSQIRMNLYSHHISKNSDNQSKSTSINGPDRANVPSIKRKESRLSFKICGLLVENSFLEMIF